MRFKNFLFVILSISLLSLWACGGGGGGGGGDDAAGGGGGAAPDFDSDTVLVFSADVNSAIIPDPTLNSVTILMEALSDECPMYNSAVATGWYRDYYLQWQYGSELNYDTVEIVDVPPNSPDENGLCNSGDTPGFAEVPKTNEAYIWGLTQADDGRVWFGTGANVQCLVSGNYLGSSSETLSTFVPVGADGTAKTLMQTCSYAASWMLHEDAAGLTDPDYDFVPADLQASLGDWRPPSINFYDLNGPDDKRHYNLEDAWNNSADPDEVAAKLLLDRTLGLRSAGSIDGVVFLAGPSFDPEFPEIKNVNVFAFKSSDATFLGSYVLPDYSNIRKWREINGDLYGVLTVAAAEAVNDVNGHVIKFVGDPVDPFAAGTEPFVVVGHLPGGGAELSEYGDGRMAVSTWPGGLDEEEGLPDVGDLVISQTAIDGLLDIINKVKPGGIYISVPIPDGGLSPANAGRNFKEVFNFSEYDPDELRALTYGGGALSYFDGSLIWGSMHVPQTLSQAYQLNSFVYDLPNSYADCRTPPFDRCSDYGSNTYLDPAYNSAIYPDRNECLSDVTDFGATPEEVAYYNTCTDVEDGEDVARRDLGISIFRGRNLATDSPQIDVLYGYDTFTTFSEPIPDSVQDWCLDYYDLQTCLNASGDPSSIFPADWHAVGAGFSDEPNGIGTPIFGGPGFGNSANNYTWVMRNIAGRLYVGTMDYYTIFSAPNFAYGAGGDLFSFSSSSQAAVVEDSNGLGNPFNYGFRTMLSGQYNSLYIGTANPFNLAPKDVSGIEGRETPGGGWELLEVKVD